MNEEQRVVLFMGIGFVLFFVSVNLPFPWWIIGLVITTVVLLIGSWPFWEDLAIAAWYLLTNKKD